MQRETRISVGNSNNPYLCQNTSISYATQKKSTVKKCRLFSFLIFFSCMRVTKLSWLDCQWFDSLIFKPVFKVSSCFLPNLQHSLQHDSQLPESWPRSMFYNVNATWIIFKSLLTHFYWHLNIHWVIFHGWILHLTVCCV